MPPEKLAMFRLAAAARNPRLSTESRLLCLLLLRLWLQDMGGRTD